LEPSTIAVLFLKAK